MEFTQEQLSDFARYVRVQKSAKYNMMSPSAVAATGLSHERYVFCIDHYDELAKAPPPTKACRSPYCECTSHRCTHPGFYDARGD